MNGAAMASHGDPMELPQGDLGLLHTDVAQRLLASTVPARLAYTGLDAKPRVLPMWFEWTRGELVMSSLAGVSKAPALRQNPDVAVTIDAEGFPCDVLLLRGPVTVTEVDGVVPEYASAAHRYLGEEEAVAFLARLDRPDTCTYRFTLRPTWVGVLDFKTRFPHVLGGVLSQER